MSEDVKDDRVDTVTEDQNEQPEVYSIVKDGSGFKLTRRDMWGAVGAAAGAAATAAACAHSKRMKRIRQMGPRTFTLPCGSPTPPNAVCICDCIQTSANYNSSTETICICDTIEVPAGQTMTGGSVCACDTVCTCNTVGGSSGGGSTWGGGGHYWHPN